MTAEQKRLEAARTEKTPWKKWGPYLTARQWGTVREDYSADGNAWDYVSHDMARSKAYRWGEDGIGGISDDQQFLCFALTIWNGRDSILKERYFGLTGPEGNHGEDVKELYYYLDNTPTHSYMKMLYKYPQQPFPYSQLVKTNRALGKNDPEFELMDTGVFDDDRYFDVFIEYAKSGTEDILIQIHVENRGEEDAEIHLLPTLWFRNTWSLGYDDSKPEIKTDKQGNLLASHKELGEMTLYQNDAAETLFCENETNWARFKGEKPKKGVYKDAFHQYLIHGKNTLSKDKKGTKAAFHFKKMVPAKDSIKIQLRLAQSELTQPFENFDQEFQARKQEADDFYAECGATVKGEDQKLVFRQALAGMLWTKQFYYFDIPQWLKGDPAFSPPPESRKHGRNNHWKHLNNSDIISMPDKWEYPWYAAWDLAFHCVPLAMADMDFAKNQLIIFTKEWYMHPNGQLPAYEWNFGDVNPPVHAWATWKVYQMDKEATGKGDRAFLESIFHKLILNFTWWVNRKDSEENNIFEGGFLGLDNIGVFDRSAELPTGGIIEQADGTSWMAMYSLNLMRIALELSLENPVYQDLATKFFEHFLYIAGAMADVGKDGNSLWDEEDEFFYDVLKLPHGETVRMKVRSLVGLAPLFAVEVLDDEILKKVPEFSERLDWFLKYRPDLASLVSRWQIPGKHDQHLLSLLRGHRMKKLLYRMLDETEFLSDYGIRALSKHHEDHPYHFETNGETYSVSYIPAESDSGLFGGNSNWRGPIWFPMNYLLIESIRNFHRYYGDEFIVEYPTGSGQKLSLTAITDLLAERLSRIFLKDENGKRPVFGKSPKFQDDPHFRDNILFYEYFHGDNGRGVGASHQTGWTGLIACLLAGV